MSLPFISLPSGFVIVPAPHEAQFSMDLDTEAIKQRLTALKSEHRDLDDVIAQLAASPTADQLQIQRLKKRKLALKDIMARLESMLLPNIIA